jgi:Uma2 family endonuclease
MGRRKHGDEDGIDVGAVSGCWEPDQRWEYVDGELRFISRTGGRHGLVIHLISKALAWWEDLAGERMCFGADVAFTMADGSWLCPDAAVVRRERLRSGVPEGPIPFPPDVAFEVRSPGDQASDVERKRYRYYLNTVTQVWVDPETETVEVVSANRPVRYFGSTETVVIEELPGFGIGLFPLPPKRAKDGKP